MSEDNKATMRRLYSDVLTHGRLDVADDVVGAEMVEHQDVPGAGSGREGFKAVVTILHRAMPDIRFVLEDLVAEGDKVVARGTWRGTHLGEFMGIPASGNRVEVPTIDIVRFEDGKAVEHWGLTDTLTMAQQLGAIPERRSAR